MGYTFDVRSLRQRWDWLRDLVARQRTQLALPERGSPSRRDALRDALERLGLDDHDLLDGVATVLGLDVATLRAPGPQALAAVFADDLALVLPLLLEHRSPSIRAVGRAWFGVPEAIYTVPSDQAERWLLDSIAAGDLLAERVGAEGLAWLGPESLRRLATTAASPLARHAAQAWCERL